MPFLETSEAICIEEFDEVLYKEALHWVREGRQVAFLSNEERASDNPRIKIHHLQSPLAFEALLYKMAWDAVLRKTQVIGSERFAKLFNHFHNAAHVILSEAAEWHVPVIKNAKENQGPHLRGLELKNRFQGIPAVIVGGGPSLKKNGHLLSQFENRALIFAGGAALGQIDVEPHFAALIDPIAPTQKVKSPLLYQPRVNPLNLEQVTQGRILFPDTASSAINWLYGEEAFDGGWTVGNFMTAAAVWMGCSPIIFVGMDLCYENGKKYAYAEGPSSFIEVGDVQTQQDWLMAAEWTKERGLGQDFINATEGGILDLPKKNLNECLEMCKERPHLKERVKTALAELSLHNLPDRFEKWQASIERLKISMDESEIVYEKLLDPLWQIWRPIFEREVEQDLSLHKQIFLAEVLEAHGAI